MDQSMSKRMTGEFQSSSLCSIAPGTIVHLPDFPIAKWHLKLNMAFFLPFLLHSRMEC